MLLVFEPFSNVIVLPRLLIPVGGRTTYCSNWVCSFDKSWGIEHGGRVHVSSKENMQSKQSVNKSGKHDVRRQQRLGAGQELKVCHRQGSQVGDTVAMQPFARTYTTLFLHDQA